jgi:hypothetical protein
MNAREDAATACSATGFPRHFESRKSNSEKAEKSEEFRGSWEWDQFLNVFSAFPSSFL